MTPAMFARLQAASTYVMDELTKKTPAADIIAGLVADHRASFRRGDPSIIRCCGVTASCMHSDGEYLLKRWNGNATVKIAMGPGNAAS